MSVVLSLPRIVLIVGMSRSGTEWMARLLNSQPGVASFGETAFWGRAYTPPRADGLYDEEILRSVIARYKRTIFSPVGEGLGSLANFFGETKKDSIARAFASRSGFLTPTETFARLCAAVSEVENARTVVEKTPHHVMWLDRIFTNMPNVKCIVMHRDGYGFLRSYKFAGQREINTKGPSFWGRRYHPIAVSLLWRGYARAIADAVKRYPHSCLPVSLDLVTREPMRAAQMVAEFLDLDPMSADTIPGRTNTSFPSDKSKRELDSADVFWLKLLAGPELARYDVRPPIEKYRLGDIVLSLARLPSYSYHLLREVRPAVSGSLSAYIWNYLSR